MGEGRGVGMEEDVGEGLQVMRIDGRVLKFCVR